MESHRIRTAVTAFLEDIWSRGDMEAVDTLLAEDFEFVLSFMRTAGRDAFKQLVTRNRTAFEDLTYRPGEVIVEGDRAVATWTMSGKHVSEWAGIAGTDREVSISGMTLFHFDGEKIADAIVQNDVFGLRQQLGAA